MSGAFFKLLFHYTGNVNFNKALLISVRQHSRLLLHTIEECSKVRFVITEIFTIANKELV